jgi:hypothetical protein
MNTDLIFELEKQILESNTSKPRNYTDEEFRASIQVFWTMALNKMYFNMPDVDECLAFDFGSELNKLILKYTNVDTHGIY